MSKQERFSTTPWLDHTGEAFLDHVHDKVYLVCLDKDNMSLRYPGWWNTIVTIYNRYEDSQTQLITWYRNVIKGCFWKYTGNKIHINNVVLETNDVICRIRKTDRFLEKQDWISIPNDEMNEYFTLAQGDILVRGEVTDTINEYVTGTRSSDLITKYKALQGCMEVQEWAINVGGGRGNEHYFVRGI